MIKAKAQPSPEAVAKLGITAREFGELSEDKAAYIEGWGVKYGAQIKALNEIVETEGLWSDGIRLF